LRLRQVWLLYVFGSYTRESTSTGHVLNIGARSQEQLPGRIAFLAHEPRRPAMRAPRRDRLRLAFGKLPRRGGRFWLAPLNAPPLILTNGCDRPPNRGAACARAGAVRLPRFCHGLAPPQGRKRPISHPRGLFCHVSGLDGAHKAKFRKWRGMCTCWGKPSPQVAQKRHEVV
jgi:hypothetical protein